MGGWGSGICCDSGYLQGKQQISAGWGSFRWHHLLLCTHRCLCWLAVDGNQEADDPRLPAISVIAVSRPHGIGGHWQHPLGPSCSSYPHTLLRAGIWGSGDTASVSASCFGIASCPCSTVGSYRMQLSYWMGHQVLAAYQVGQHMAACPMMPVSTLPDVPANPGNPYPDQH